MIFFCRRGTAMHFRILFFSSVKLPILYYLCITLVIKQSHLIHLVWKFVLVYSIAKYSLVFWRNTSNEVLLTFWMCAKKELLYLIQLVYVVPRIVNENSGARDWVWILPSLWSMCPVWPGLKSHSSQTCIYSPMSVQHTSYGALNHPTNS